MDVLVSLDSVIKRLERLAASNAHGPFTLEEAIENLRVWDGKEPTDIYGEKKRV